MSKKEQNLNLLFFVHLLIKGIKKRVKEKQKGAAQ
jgi:hypothetical protein